MSLKMNVNLISEFKNYPPHLVNIAKKIILANEQNKPISVIKNMVENEINLLISEKGDENASN